MPRPRPKLKINAPQQINAQTRFHIDYDWWEKSNLDLNAYLASRLNIENNIVLDTTADTVDTIDPHTGEVRQVDGFQYALQTYLRQLPADFMQRTSLVDSVFCVLLANESTPMTAEAIAEAVSRPVDTIIKMFGGSKIYQGIRPLLDE